MNKSCLAHFGCDLCSYAQCSSVHSQTQPLQTDFAGSPCCLCGPGLGRSPGATCSLGSPNMLRDSARVGSKMVKMALSPFGVFTLKWSVLCFQERWLFASAGETSSPWDRRCVWKVVPEELSRPWYGQLGSKQTGTHRISGTWHLSWLTATLVKVLWQQWNVTKSPENSYHLSVLIYLLSWKLHFTSCLWMPQINLPRKPNEASMFSDFWKYWKIGKFEADFAGASSEIRVQ